MSDASVRIPLAGRIDANNAAAVEAEVRSRLAGRAPCPLILDAEKLEYISSAGLRVLLRLKKAWPELTLTGVGPQVYEILETTGFVGLCDVERE